MILRLTAKLAREIGTKPEDCLPLDMNPYLDWVGHLFTAKRTQYIILSNTASLYSIIMPGRGVTDEKKLVQQAMVVMEEVMRSDGLEFLFRRFIVPSTGITRYSKINDKKVLGSIVEMTKEAQFWLTERELSPLEATAKVNEAPMSYLKYASPKEAFTQLKPGVSFG